MQEGIFDVTLWEGTVLLNFRILNTYPYDIVIKYGAYSQTRTNHLEDLEKTEVKRPSGEGIEKTQKKNMALQFTRTMDNSKKLKVRIFYMKNDGAGNNFSDDISMFFLTAKYI